MTIPRRNNNRNQSSNRNSIINHNTRVYNNNQYDSRNHSNTRNYNNSRNSNGATRMQINRNSGTNHRSTHTRSRRPIQHHSSGSSAHMQMSR